MMTMEEIQKVINNIEHPRIETIQVKPRPLSKNQAGSPKIIILIGFRTLDRDDISKEFVISNNCEVSTKDLNPHFLISIIRELLFTLALHEIDELYEYKGKRLYDPHKTYNFANLIYALGEKEWKYKMGVANKPELDVVRKKKEAS